MEQLVPVDCGGDIRPAVRLGLLLRDSDFGIWPVSAYRYIHAFVGDSEEYMGHMQTETHS